MARIYGPSGRALESFNHGWAQISLNAEALRNAEQRKEQNHRRNEYLIRNQQRKDRIGSTV